jgi:hypothetical protein
LYWGPDRWIYKLIYLPDTSRQKRDFSHLASRPPALEPLAISSRWP